jgi:Na+-translocating ferredoxin:NAD+ oxidoreductase RnfD subunit
VAYSIIFMNTLTPLIDRWMRPRVYGSTTPKPEPRKT